MPLFFCPSHRSKLPSIDCHRSTLQDFLLACALPDVRLFRNAPAPAITGLPETSGGITPSGKDTRSLSLLWASSNYDSSFTFVCIPLGLGWKIFTARLLGELFATALKGKIPQEFNPSVYFSQFFVNLL